MAAPKGHPQWGGIKKGQRWRRTIERENALKGVTAKAAATIPPAQLCALSPLEGLKLAMQWALDNQDRSGFLAAASAAAPYVHPKLAMTDLRVTNSFAEKTFAELMAEREELEQKRLAAQPIEGTAVDLTSESLEPAQLNQIDRESLQDLDQDSNQALDQDC